MTDQQPTEDWPDEVDYEAMSPEEQDDYDRLNDGPRVGWDGELYDSDGRPL